MSEPLSIYVVMSQHSYYPSGDDYDWKFITTDYDTALASARNDEQYNNKYGWTSIARISLPDCTHTLVWESTKDS